MVAADLRHGILREDENADDHHEDAADHTQQCVVLLDLGLEHRIEGLLLIWQTLTKKC